MKKTKKAVTHKAKSAKSSQTLDYVAHESPFIKFGIVFIYVFSIMLFAWAVAYALPPIK